MVFSLMMIPVSMSHHRVLVGMWGEILEGPLHVLVRGEHAGELGRLVAAQPQQAIVGWQHDPVKDHHLLVIVVSPVRRINNILSYFKTHDVVKKK